MDIYLLKKTNCIHILGMLLNQVQAEFFYLWEIRKLILNYLFGDILIGNIINTLWSHAFKFIELKPSLKIIPRAFIIWLEFNLFESIVNFSNQIWFIIHKLFNNQKKSVVPSRVIHNIFDHILFYSLKLLIKQIKFTHKPNSAKVFVRQ